MAGSWANNGCGTENVGGSPSADRILEVLQAAPRRYILTYLVDKPNRAVQTDELVDHIVDKCDLSDHPEERRQIGIRLYHHHLPKLAEKGIIEFDPRNDQLRYTPDNAVERWLEGIHGWITESNSDS